MIWTAVPIPPRFTNTFTLQGPRPVIAAKLQASLICLDLCDARHTSISGGESTSSQLCRLRSSDGQAIPASSDPFMLTKLGRQLPYNTHACFLAQIMLLGSLSWRFPVLGSQEIPASATISYIYAVSMGCCDHTIKRNVKERQLCGTDCCRALCTY